MKDTNYPYCNAEVEICHDDGYGYSEDDQHQQYCGSCKKTFVYETTITFSYETSKADCLNGANHNFKPTHTHPKEFTRMRCNDCGEERNLTPTEREYLGIATVN